MLKPDFGLSSEGQVENLPCWSRHSQGDTQLPQSHIMLTLGLHVSLAETPFVSLQADLPVRHHARGTGNTGTHFFICRCSFLVGLSVIHWYHFI